MREEYGRQALRLRSMAAQAHAWLPRVYVAGRWGPPRYTNSDTLGMAVNDPNLPAPDSVAGFLAAYQAQGYDFIKVHYESPIVLDSVLAAAARLGLPVAGHLPKGVTMDRLPRGYRSIEHPMTEYAWTDTQSVASLDATQIGRLAAHLRDAGVWNCPTQSHYARFHGYAPGRGVPVLKILQDSGVKLLLGTDELPWLGVITSELHALVRAGLTPYQALLTGTRNVAEYFGTLARSGTVAVGKQADLVLVAGNPLDDVRHTAHPVGVLLGGRWLSHVELARRLKGLTLATQPSPNGTMKEVPVDSTW
jgi:imidazolonepropionase-like amidohydrolase